MTRVPRAVAIPENTTLHICGRKQRLKKAAWDCRTRGCLSETTRASRSYNRTVLSDLKNRHFYLQQQLKLLLFPEMLLQTSREMWELPRRWENSHTVSVSLSLMPLCLANIEHEITPASADSFVGDIFLIKLLWTITTKQCEISPCFCSSQTEKCVGHVFFLSNERTD